MTDLDLYQCATPECGKRYTREQITEAPCTCGGSRFLNVQDLEHGQCVIKKLVNDEKKRRAN